MRSASVALLVSIVILQWPSETDAHKGVTSRFTYNGEVYPIFLERCGQCHIAGGVGPMSLLSYQEAFPWAESLRAELLETEGGASDESGNTGFVRTAHRNLSARELDIILDWATGGTPEGDPGKTPSPVQLKNDWSHGAPNLVLPLPANYQMPAETMEATHEVVIPITTPAARDANAIDVLPGTPSIVREVVVSVSSANSAPRVIATWTPKQNPAPVVLNPPVRLAEGDQLLARFHYKKTWKYEGQALTDRSTIGVYFNP